MQSGRFDPAEARASLETSLRELGVETVDLLLLHEVRPADLETEGLYEFLERSRSRGQGPLLRNRDRSAVHSGNPRPSGPASPGSAVRERRT